MLFALISIAVIPFGTESLAAINLGPVHIPAITTAMQLTDLNIGVLFILGISGMGVYGVALAGWSSNNKYSLLGGLRSSAQMISYELPMAMAIAAPLLMLNTLSFRGIVDGQAGFIFGFIPRWTIFQGPFPQIFSFIMFIIAAFAETNRVPFDLPEAENELVAGFHTEYGSMKFAAFFMAEYANMVTVSCVGDAAVPRRMAAAVARRIRLAVSCRRSIFAGAGVICFSHGMNPARPFDRITLPVFGVVFLGLAGIFLIPDRWRHRCCRSSGSSAKVGFMLFVFIWIRGTLPRFRYDQLMSFAWTFLFPVASSTCCHRPGGGPYFEITMEVRDHCFFMIFAAIAVVCGINVVVQTHPISSALSLVGVMGALAVLYLLLGGEFIAAAQLIVYAGAIMVLFIFVIMLLNAGTERKRPRALWASYAGVPLLAGLLGLIAAL